MTTQEIRLTYQDYAPDSGMPPRLWMVYLKTTTREETSSPPGAFVGATETCFHSTEDLEAALVSVKFLATNP